MGKKMDELPELDLVGVTQEFLEKIKDVLTKEAYVLVREGAAFAVAALEEGSFAGVLCAAILEEELELRIYDIFTVPEKRRQGVASTLLEETAERVNENMDFMLHRVRCVFTQNGQEGIPELFEACGYDVTPTENATNYIFTAEEVKESYLWKQELPQNPETIIRLGELGKIQYATLMEAVEEYGGQYDTEAIQYADSFLSRSLWKGNRPVAVAEFGEDGENNIILLQFFILSIDTDALAMLKGCLKDILKKYGSSITITVPIVSQSSERLLKKLLGEVHKKEGLLEAEYSFLEYGGENI